MIPNKKSRVSVVVILATVIVGMLLFTACGKQKATYGNGAVDLYFVDSNQTNLVTISYEIKNEKVTDKVREILEQMNKKSKKINYIPAIPDSVNISNVLVSDKTLYIDFDSNYLQMKKVEELLCRSAIVLTMTQLNEIDYVSFKVNHNQYLSATGMKAADFVDNSGSNINAYQELEVVLYYANESGDKLIATNYSGLYAQNTSVEKFIIERLIKGPTNSNYKRTLPSGLKLVSVITKDGICYVDFDSTFLEGRIDVQPEIQLYSVVNSLVELAYVNKVQISINGETDKKYRDYVSLQDAFNRNLDIIIE